FYPACLCSFPTRRSSDLRAFLIFSYIDQIEILVLTRLLLLRVVRIGNERLAPLIFRERFEQVDDFVELPWISSPGIACGARLISSEAQTSELQSPDHLIC